MLICAIDIGNTNTNFGIYNREGKILLTFKLESDTSRTEDEFFIFFRDIITNFSLNVGEISGFCISSVVPSLQDTFEAMIKKYFPNSEIVILGPGVKTGISVRYNPPSDVGADRIANAVGAWEKYAKDKKAKERLPIVVVDFGTAITFDCINQKGEYVGGAIFPGIGLALESLFKKTAKLPQVQLKEPGEVIGKSTIHSIQSGIVYGYSSMINGMLDKISDEFGTEILPIATGGYAEIIVPHTKIKIIDKALTLDGLYYVFIKNSKLLKSDERTQAKI